MSRRYECGSAREVEVGTMSGREAAGEQILTRDEIAAGEHALIIGDPYATAYAVTGTREELRKFAATLATFVDGLPGLCGCGTMEHPPGVVGCVSEKPPEKCRYAAVDGDPAIVVCLSHGADFGLYGDEWCDEDKDGAIRAEAGI